MRTKKKAKLVDFIHFGVKHAFPFAGVYESHEYDILDKYQVGDERSGYMDIEKYFRRYKIGAMREHGNRIYILTTDEFGNLQLWVFEVEKE
jgi:hypothetical protein